MPGRRAIGLLLAFALFGAGCLDGGTTADPVPLGDAAPVDLPPLALPQVEIDAILMRGGPAMGAGEPAIAFAPDGTRYVAVTGCQDLPSLTGLGAIDERCWHSPVYRSDDAGATWTLLNQGADGRLDPSAPAGNADADVAVDGAGSVYVVNLAAGGIHVQRSGDRGATWTYLGDLAGGEGADRPWVAARGAGEVVVAWHQGGVSHVRASRDGGASWTETAEAPADASQLGAIVLRDECWCADVPLVLADEGASGLDGTTFGIHVARLDLDAAEWTVQDTQARWQASATGLHTSGSLVFPTLARSADGTWAIAWSEEQNAPGGGSSTAARVKVSFSADGAAWTAPSDVTPTTSAVMPWLAGGPADRFLLAVYTSDLPLDTDYVGRWDVRLLALEAGTSTVLQAVVAADVHAGGICTRGTLCPAYASDRALLDNLEVAIGPGFAVGLAFGADPPTDAKRIAIRALAASWDPART